MWEEFLEQERHKLNGLREERPHGQSRTSSGRPSPRTHLSFSQPSIHTSPHQHSPRLASLCFSLLFPLCNITNSCGFITTCLKAEFPANLRLSTWALKPTVPSPCSMPFLPYQCEQISSLHPSQLNATSRELSVDPLVECPMSLPCSLVASFRYLCHEQPSSLVKTPNLSHLPSSLRLSASLFYATSESQLCHQQR